MFVNGVVFVFPLLSGVSVSLSSTLLPAGCLNADLCVDPRLCSRWVEGHLFIGPVDFSTHHSPTFNVICRVVTFLFFFFPFAERRWMLMFAMMLAGPCQFSSSHKRAMEKGNTFPTRWFKRAADLMSAQEGDWNLRGSKQLVLGWMSARLCLFTSSPRFMIRDHDWMAGTQSQRLRWAQFSLALPYWRYTLGWPVVGPLFTKDLPLF